MARIGEIVDKKYEIIKQIGKGGMSYVYLAMDKRLGKQWAIKEYRKDKSDQDRHLALESLKHEAQLMKKLDHPTLPRILDIVEERDTVYVIMDYIEGQPMDKVLEEFGPQPQEAVIEWAKQLCEVLDYLHTQNPPVIYRDMKPSNIMLKPDGTIRLFDFGIAREYKEGAEDDTKNLGTRGYAAPELSGRGQSDSRADIYSLGVTLYHMLTGKDPREQLVLYPIRHWNDTLSGALEWLVQKCHQLNPDERFQSCAEMLYVLENLEKFDADAIADRKRKLRRFFASLGMTITLTAASIGCFIGAQNAHNNEYDQLYYNKQYLECIEKDEERPDAYEALASELYLVTKLHKNDVPESQRGDWSENEMAYQDLKNIFTNERMNELRKNDPQVYIYVNYEMGRMLWNSYEERSSAAAVANPYFGKVLSAVKDVQESGGQEYGGLEEAQYNLAKAYYMVTFFQKNLDPMKSLNDDDGVFRVSAADREAAEAAGIEGIDGSITNPYEMYWASCGELLKLVVNSDANSMRPQVRLETLERLAYILQENCDTFRDMGGVTGGQMQSFIGSFRTALDGLDGVGIDEEKAVLCDELNATLRFIRSTYDIDVEAFES